MSVGIDVQVDGLDEVAARLHQLEGMVFGGETIGDVVGAVVESQTRRRLQDEKRAPATGVPWAPWSADYALTRHGNHSLLVDTGALQDSITYQVHGDTVEVGSNLVYAARHQYGDGSDAGSLGDLVGGIPARPFLGVSAENAVEITNACRDFMDAILGGAR